MIKSFIISILANYSTMLTDWLLKKLLKRDNLVVQIKNAHKRAVSRWTVNDYIRERENYNISNRLNQLIEYIQNPSNFKYDKSTNQLIEYFNEEIKKEPVAWKYIEDEKYKVLYSLIRLIKEDENLKPEFVFKTLKYNSENQIKKQISSGKYIPDTFIETNELKDHLRYFVAPTTFFSKIFNETKNLNFSHLNRINKLKGKEPYKFDFTIFQDISRFSYNELLQETSKIIDYLEKKHFELEKQRSNLSYAFKRKIEMQKESFEFLNYKAVLLTDDAGQGKTNILCDFTENVLIKREIPTIFVNGYELDANDIGNSIARKLFPNDNYTFNEVIDVIKMHLENKQLIIVIDGINENKNPKVFSRNLENFLETTLQNDFINIIMSCRTEYYWHNFQNIIQSSFSERIKLIDGLNNKLDKHQKEKLIQVYFKHFNIKIDSINKEIKRVLADNFLLLRIFSEVNSNKQIPNLSHIYKTELFSEYYSIKVEEINKRLKENDEFNVKGSFSIPEFIKNTAIFMISNGIFHNIPLDEIIKNSENKEVYIRFLDENILLRKGLEQSEDLVFRNREVVNFTFDEFRDFIISKYLIDEVFHESEEDFKEFVDVYLTEQSPILEGTSVFLYSLNRKINNTDLNDFLKKQNWYNKAFLKVIFNTPDKEITINDKDIIKQIFIEDKFAAQKISKELNYKRFDFSRYNNLNINLLFEIFDTLTDEQFRQLVYPVYQDYYNSLDKLIKKIGKLLDELEPIHLLLFKHILYFIPLSYEVKEVYYEFYLKTENVEFLKDLLKVKSIAIVNEIKQFITDYDIQL